jgi:hypothetical protein
MRTLPRLTSVKIPTRGGAPGDIPEKFDADHSPHFQLLPPLSTMAIRSVKHCTVFLVVVISRVETDLFKTILVPTGRSTLNFYRYLHWLSDLGTAGVALVGGKNASPGEMVRTLRSVGICVPNRLAMTTSAYC